MVATHHVDTGEEQAAWLARSLGRGALAPLSPEDIAELSGEFGETRYAGGTCIFRRGEAPAQVHVVKSGTVELARDVGGRRVALRLARAGDVVGDVPVFLRMLEPFDACAVEDSVILSIDSVALYRLLERRPHLARRWLVSLAGRMSEFQERIVDLLSGSLESQIASYLLHEAVDGELRMSQETLAKLLGARRTSVNQALRRMEERGVLTTGYRKIRVLDRDGLSELVGARLPAS